MVAKESEAQDRAVLCPGSWSSLVQQPSAERISDSPAAAIARPPVSVVQWSCLSGSHGRYCGG